MALISFAKHAGRPLPADATDEAAARAAAESIARELSAKLQRRRMEAALTLHVKSLGLVIDHLYVECGDDVVEVSGRCSTQAEKEKVLLAVGNTSGVGIVSDRVEVFQLEPEADFYTVAPGDTLADIAHRFYGQPDKGDFLWEANRPLLDDPNRLYPGQALRIPHRSFALDSTSQRALPSR